MYEKEALAKESLPYHGASLWQAAMLGGLILEELVDLSKGRNWSSWVKCGSCINSLLNLDLFHFCPWWNVD